MREEALIRRLPGAAVAVVISTARGKLNAASAALGVSLVVAAGVLFVAYGTAGDETPTSSRAAAVATDRVQVEDFKYVPETVTVAAGTTLTWVNEDSAPHTSTSGASPSPDGEFDTGTFVGGASGTVTLSEPGTYAYYCALHPFMRATVIVE
ncbi:MAG: cupredoxin family copper-binding protein [Solirubrobacteraceae bacterium]|nr:cupredoxin family copper-binding protein [Solirubrobacteraceae bacterium]